MHDQPWWLRIKAMAASRAHRAMKKYGLLKLGTNLCPQVDEKFAELEAGKITLGQLREWLGQVHTDYVSALDQTQEKLIKLRIRLMNTERSADSKIAAFDEAAEELKTELLAKVVSEVKGVKEHYEAKLRNKDEEIRRLKSAGSDPGYAGIYG